jgi:hypothetical protein
MLNVLNDALTDSYYSKVTLHSCIAIRPLEAPFLKLNPYQSTDTIIIVKLYYAALTRLVYGVKSMKHLTKL